MGYFDGLVANAFRTDERGNHLVSPFGVLGKSRRFRTEKDYIQAHHFLAGSYKIALPLIILASISVKWLGWYAAPIFALMLLLWAAVVLPRITRNSDPVDARDSYVDQLRRSGRAHSGTQLMLMTLMSAAFAVGGVFLATNGSTTGYLATAFFGLCAVVLTAMMILRR